MKKILGLDISSKLTGWAILKNGRFYKRENMDYGKIQIPSNMPLAEKLVMFRNELIELFGTIPDITHIGIEDTFLGRNAKTLKLLNKFQGVACEAIWETFKVDPLIVPVKEIRATFGTQGKQNIYDMMIKKYKLEDWKFTTHNDITDALAIALHTHIVSKGKKDEK